VPGVAGIDMIVVVEQVLALVPHELAAATQIFPLVVPKSTVITLLVPPLVIVAPVGTAQR